MATIATKKTVAKAPSSRGGGKKTHKKPVMPKEAKEAEKIVKQMY